MWRTAEDDEEDRRFWEEPTPYTPESRLETHRYIEEKRKARDSIRYVFLFYNIFWELKMNNFLKAQRGGWRLPPIEYCLYLCKYALKMLVKYTGCLLFFIFYFLFYPLFCFLSNRAVKYNNFSFQLHCLDFRISTVLPANSCLISCLTMNSE